MGPANKIGWYIGPEMDDYRFHNLVVAKIGAEQLSNKVKLN